MKLVIPYIDEIRPADARLIRIAEFLGIPCVPVSMEVGRFGVFQSDLADGEDCLLMNPEVICECLQGEVSSVEFVSVLLSKFHRVLAHRFRSDPLHTALLTNLTDRSIQPAKHVQSSSGTILIAAGSEDICGAFSGLSIPVPKLANHWVIDQGEKNGFRELITVDKGLLFGVLNIKKSEILLIGSEDVIDLDAEIGDAWLAENFMGFIPYAMALRYIFGDRSWHPAQNQASLIIDDPLLRPNYGFLNFLQLLRLMREHNFATTIAFIPHNFRRSSPQTVALFQQNSNQLSICFHGNDHTGAEFATNDAALLNTVLFSAELRMSEHERNTGLICDRSMVFPQGRFSRQAMASLRCHNFEAAINTNPHTYGQRQKLTLRDRAEPALLRYSGFPLFLRKYSQDTHEVDIAFNLFFGIPILLVEHHDVFADPQRLTEAVQRINRAAPNIRWCSAGEAVRGSLLRRRVSRDLIHIKAYARTVQVDNPRSVPQDFIIEWACLGSTASLAGVYSNDRYSTEFNADESGVRTRARIDGGRSERFTMRDIPAGSSGIRLGFRHTARVFIRRRLSELRDNYLSKSPGLLAAAKTIQKSLSIGIQVSN
jgi:hypothetical protein